MATYKKSARATGLISACLLFVAAFVTTGCGGLMYAIQDSNRTFHGPVGSASKETPQEERVIYNLFVRSANYPVFSLIKDSNARAAASFFNFFLPLPSTPMVEYISFDIRGLNEKDRKLLDKEMGIHFLRDKNANDGGFYYALYDYRNLSLSLTYKTMDHVYVTIEGLHGKEIFDKMVKTLNMPLSAASQKTYREALAPTFPQESENSKTQKEVFGW